MWPKTRRTVFEAIAKKMRMRDAPKKVWNRPRNVVRWTRGVLRRGEKTSFSHLVRFAQRHCPETVPERVLESIGADRVVGDCMRILSRA
jgi:hypothetical protein